MKQKYKLLEMISCILFFISDICLAMLFFTDLQAAGVKKYTSYIFPAVFWVTLIAALAIQTVLFIREPMHKQIKGRMGAINFFSSKTAIVFDVLTIVSLIVFVVLSIIKDTSFFAFLILALFVFSFEMHCVVNGKIYKYLIEKSNK